jgi:hypothetical protein
VRSNQLSYGPTQQRRPRLINAPRPLNTMHEQPECVDLTTTRREPGGPGYSLERR